MVEVTKKHKPDQAQLLQLFEQLPPWKLYQSTEQNKLNVSSVLLEINSKLNTKHFHFTMFCCPSMSLTVADLHQSQHIA